MEESHHHHHHQHHHQSQQQQRLGLRNTAGGEIVEVQGGHIVRSTGRKDRHSKVCTAKGPRDRRVRLSAHTAIQFYDVQDRLGYDRPSKAVDWLIKKAKAAIDELAELPAWRPTTSNPSQQAEHGEEEDEKQRRRHIQQGPQQQNESDAAAAGKKPMEAEVSAYGFQQLNNNPTGFLPPSLDSEAIADTIKSFFPMASSSSSIHFQNYPPDLLSRTSSQAQDLRLSLQSFHDPTILIQHQHQQQHHHHQQQQAALFTGSTPLSFDAASSTGWSDQQQSEMGRFQRLVAWNAAEAGAGSSSSSSGGYVFNAPPPPSMPLQQLLGQNPFFPQRGPLQSSSSPSIRPWAEPPSGTADPQMVSLHHPPPSAISGIGFAAGGLSGFRIPARIQGEEEHDAVAGNKPSSASSVSRH